MTDENDDVFSDAATETSEVPATEETVETSQEAEAETEATEQQGDENAETPAAEKDKVGKSAEKMIPESRLKAALKDVNDKLEATRRELADIRAIPTPDRETDPEGYAQHIRIEESRDLVREVYADYDETIVHFQEMAKSNPTLNEVVAKHRNPAKMAYDLAKRDMEIRELQGLKASDEWKQFQDWKAGKSEEVVEAPNTAKQLGGQTKAVTSKVPNLNRNATAVNPGKATHKDNDDELFKGHYSSR